ncbi:plastocyanin [Nitrosopumilus sp.]|uniref:plastocyanin n=1 Tax=Nitrosopumilus sp. TaxID=2024843 RepID=UPI0026134158|nr:plastocyanin [Nitrosopumilus sp.]
MKIILIGVLVAMLLSTSYAPNSFSQKAVPDWVKQTAGWYSDGLVSEKEFLDAIRFLVENKIILLEDKILDDPTLKTNEVSVTKPKIRQCEVLFQSYKNIGVTQFKTKYSHITYLDSCLKLYSDPIWKYEGLDRYDKLSEKLTSFNVKSEPKKPSDPYTSILSKTKIGDEKYLVKFNICAGDKIIDKAKVLVKSQIEAIQVGSNKDVPANSCRNYETQIFAKNPDNIFVEILEQVLG